MSKLKIKNKYSTIPNELLNNDKISLKAKGLFAYLQGKPDYWKFSKNRMVSQLKEGLSSIKSCIKELKEHGYLETVPKKDKHGKFIGHDYLLDDKPSVGKPTPPKTHRSENHTCISKKDLSKKDNSKKDITKVIEPKAYGREDINQVIEFLKEKNNGMIDCSIAINRRYAKFLIDKIKKAYPDEDTVLQIKAIIQTALQDEFHSKNATSMKYLYYNTQKIVQTIKSMQNRVVEI